MSCYRARSRHFKTLAPVLLLFLTACIEDSNSPISAASPTPVPTTLTTSISSLVLGKSGAARTITITNTGTVTATAVVYTLSPALPAGTTITPPTCGNILAAGTCVMTVTPGATPSTAAPATPIPAVMTLAGSNTNTLTPSITILDFGNVYQAGYVFAIDDTTPNSGSIGGKVAALTDASAGVIWSSNGTSGVVDNFNIPGIYENSVAPCHGNIDGACNTAEIVAHYSPSSTYPLAYYAAGLCKATQGGYSDWYLPSICELGPDSTSANSGCGTSGSPTLQNMQTNLVNNGNIGSLNGTYWSSTEPSGSPTTLTWVHIFATAGGDFQGQSGKASTFSVRCTRAITL